MMPVLSVGEPSRPCRENSRGEWSDGSSLHWRRRDRDEPAAVYRSSPDSPLEGAGFELPVPRRERLGFRRYGGDRLSTQACHRAVASLGKPIEMLGGHSTGRRSPANPAASARAALSAMRTHRGAGSSNPSPSRGGVREPSVPARCRSTDSSKPLAPPWRGHPAPWPVGRRSRLQGHTEKYRNRRSTTGTWST